MNALKKVTIKVPTQLFEKGLTEAHIHGLINRWLIISLFQQNKISATEASELLATDREGFFAMLDQQGILYKNIRENREESPRISPLLAELAQTKSVLAVMEEELAETRYNLYKAKKELEEMDRVKSEFIATVSHELRTPLNSIIGFAKLLLNQNIGPLNEIQHTDLSIVYSSALHLQNLVNDILDISKIDAGKIRLDKEWVTIEEIIVGVMPSTLLLIEDKPIELKEDIEPNLPKVYVDRGRIRQIVLNLLSNAAKFTDTGTIHLRVYPLTKAEKAYICFSVTDTGIGIAPENVDKVFEAFRQVDSSLGRRAEGTGLGLPISKRLARLHRGELWFESTLGRGSTFYFTIPVNPPETDKANTISVEVGV